MTEGSKILLYLLLGLTGLWFLLVLLSLGPVGWFAILVLIVGTLVYSERTGDDGPRLERTNCADCGAPNAATRETCKHCDTPL